LTCFRCFHRFLVLDSDPKPSIPNSRIELISALSKRESKDGPGSGQLGVWLEQRVKSIIT
jgi:hypothetical protein